MYSKSFTFISVQNKHIWGFMDWDLWGAPYYSEDRNLCTPLEWLFDFCFHSGLDLIEEDAFNEKLCIQVLRILITKADTEIDELEQDLIFLQSELAWIENEEWSKFVFNALMVKIDSLDASMKSLKNDKADDVESHLLMHAQPVERLHEILKAVFESYLSRKDAQPRKAGVTDSSFYAPKLEAGFTADGIKSNSSSSISIEKKNSNKIQSLTSNSADTEKHHVEKLELQDVDFKEEISAEGFHDFTLDETVEHSSKELQVDSEQIGKELSEKGILRNLPDRKEKNPVQKLKVEETGALALLLEQQEKRGKCVNMLKPKEEEITLPEVEMSMKGKKRQNTLAIVEWKAVKREKLDSECLPLKSLHIPLISEVGSDSEAIPIPSCTVMEKMRLAELRKIAKCNKFSRYYHLNKKELIHFLASRNGGK